MRFSLRNKVGGEGAMQSPNIRYVKNSDISPITKKSSRLVSHFSPLPIRILLRVISKGRDKIVEIGSK